MKALVGLLASAIWILGIVYHLWTVIIAFQYGIISAIATFFLPVLSQIYWFFKMWDVNTPYIVVSIVFLIVALVVSVFNRD